MSTPLSSDDVEAIFDKMTDGFSDKSGQSEVAYVGQLIGDVMHNEIYEKKELDEDSLDMLDSSLQELIDAATSAQNYLQELRTE